MTERHASPRADAVALYVMYVAVGGVVIVVVVASDRPGVANPAASYPCLSVSERGKIIADLESYKAVQI